MPIKFVNIGEDPLINPDPNIWEGRRQWKACLEYNFISAGQGQVYSRQLFRLHINDLFAAYSTQRGYLGIGQVCKEPEEIKYFSFNGHTLDDFNINPGVLNGKIKTKETVTTRPYLRQSIFCNANNVNTEYAVKVKWLRYVDHEDAKWRSGLFAKQHIVCSLANQIDTINFLSKVFGIELQ